jgi:hypothetical protein
VLVDVGKDRLRELADYGRIRQLEVTRTADRRTASTGWRSSPHGRAARRGRRPETAISVPAPYLVV